MGPLKLHIFSKYKYPILSVLIMLGLLVYVAKKSAPIAVGTAEDYWEFACGIETEKFDGYFQFANRTGIFPPRDEWFFYYYQEHHGRHMFKVRKQELLKQLDEVLVLLDKEIVSSVQDSKKEEAPLVAKNKRRNNCQEIRLSVGSDEERFINAVSKNGSDNPEYSDDLLSFDKEWERSELYWASIFFEAIFLPLWWLFSFHSGVFGRYNKKFSTRLAFSPLILAIPFYLGYSPYLFAIGESGGIIYPFFVALLSFPFYWIPYNSIDVALLTALPKPLFYISQIPFSQMAMSFSGGISPSALCVFAFIVLVLSKVLKKCTGGIRGK